MNLVKLATEYLLCWGEAAQVLKNPRVILPFVVLAAVQALVLTVFLIFPTTPLVGALSGIMSAVFGPEVLHYPTHLVYLPQMYHLISIPLTVLLGFPLFGIGVSKVIRASSGATTPGFARTGGYIFSSISIGLLFVLVIYGVQLGTSFIAGLMGLTPLAGLVKLAVMVFLVLVQALLVYALYFVVKRGAGPVRAVKSSIGFSKKRIILTALLVGTVVVLHQPVDFVVDNPDKVALKFKPEVIPVMMFAGIVLEIFTNFFLFASTTLLALREERS